MAYVFTWHQFLCGSHEPQLFSDSSASSTSSQCCTSFSSGLCVIIFEDKSDFYPCKWLWYLGIYTHNKNIFFHSLPILYYFYLFTEIQFFQCWDSLDMNTYSHAHIIQKTQPYLCLIWVAHVTVRKRDLTVSPRADFGWESSATGSVVCLTPAGTQAAFTYPLRPTCKDQPLS